MQDIAQLVTGLIQKQSRGSTPSRVADASATAEKILQLVLATAIRVTGLQLEMDSPLMASGLDSLGALELRDALQELTAAPIPSTLVFDYPSARAIADFILAAEPGYASPFPGYAQCALMPFEHLSVGSLWPQVVHTKFNIFEECFHDLDRFQLAVCY